MSLSIPLRAGRSTSETHAQVATAFHGEGSAFGPDLSRIGAARSIKYVRDSIVNPLADVPQKYQGITVVTKDGRNVTGVPINEDTFSVQLRDASQSFQRRPPP